MNFYSLYSTILRAVKLDTDPVRYVDQPYEKEEDIQRAALEIKNRMKDSFFLDGEKEKIIFPVQNNVMLKASKAQDVVEDKLKRKVMRKGL